MTFVFLLQHSNVNDNTEKTKIIGIYSTQKRAELTMEKYKALPGFKDYPESFFIDKYEIDKGHWEEGFISWDNAN